MRQVEAEICKPTIGGSRSGAPRKLVGRRHQPRRDWIIQAMAAKEGDGSKWHGFGQLADGFNILDPIKSTIVTPA